MRAEQRHDRSSLVSNMLQRVFGRSANQPLDYEEAKRLLQSADPADRRRVARNETAKPEILYYLATDPDTGVRLAVAANESTPVQAEMILAKDGDEGVRSDLARKITRFAATLGERQADRLQQMTYDVLTTLIDDEAVRVRRVVAETLKDMPGAPKEIVRQLATDPELAVSEPVLRYSPVLSDDDLLHIIAHVARPGQATAIARRQGLSECVSDAIGLGDDVDAITALLENKSAQIREETLEGLIDRASAHTPWHKPMVDRPRLSNSGARKLARFVAHDLIARLRHRSGLSVETVAALREIVLERLEKEEVAGISPADRLMEEARRMKSEGHLDENTVVEALIGNRPGFVKAAVAVLSDLPLTVVDKILDAQSPKAVASLSWKAGLSMRFAVRLQTVLLRLAASQILTARSDGSYPLNEDAMTWQIDFFKEMVASPKSA